MFSVGVLAFIFVDVMSNGIAIVDNALTAVVGGSFLVVRVTLVPAQRGRLGARRMPIRDDVLVLGRQLRRGMIEVVLGVLLAPLGRGGLGAAGTTSGVFVCCVA
jgi:hypothetical protein